MRRLKDALCAMLVCALAGCIHLPPVADMSAGVSLDAASPRAATVPFTLDDNRVFVEVSFVRPDGGARKVLAFVNPGQGGLTLSNALFRELDPRPGRPLHMKFGTMDIAVDGAAVLPESLSNNMTIGLDPFGHGPTPAEAAHGRGGEMADFAAPLPVEAVIPPGLLQHFQVVFDYGARTMTLAAPGTLMPDGIAVPIRVNPKTGFAMMDATIDGTAHVFVLDNGGSYGGLRDAAPLIAAHPQWLRAMGGVGEANLTMQGAEVGVPVVKARNVAFGPLTLDELGVIQMGGGGPLNALAAHLFWDDIYSAKAGEDVDGMLGGNVLKSFRLTIDYPGRMSYWRQEAPLDTHDLDQVGLTLARSRGMTTVAGIAGRNGADTVSGVAPGDRLVKIDGRDTGPMTRGELLAALHGTPGEAKHLTLERDGRPFTVDAPVTGF
ncbi:MAG: hypothetical protein WDN01_09270 [Rhizomicrobium sp.]